MLGFPMSAGAHHSVVSMWIAAWGNERRSARSAGVAIRTSPRQHGSMTSMRDTLFGSSGLLRDIGPVSRSAERAAISISRSRGRPSEFITVVDHGEHQLT